MNVPRTATATLVAALRAIPADLHDEEGIVSAAILEGAARIEELAKAAAAIPILPSIVTQDQMATADPIYEVRVHERIYGIAEGFEDGHVWVEDESGEYGEASPRHAKRLDERKANGDSTGKWRWCGYRNTHEVITCAFTAEGARAFIERNRHNMQRKYGEAYVYANSLYRNHEMLAIRLALINAAKAAQEQA